MKYRDILGVNENFQYSINLQYDLNNIEKFRGYIPTKQSLEVLNEYLENILSDNTNKSTVLIGPYGKGKSHLLLVLLNLLKDNKTTKEEKLAVIEKFKHVDNKTYELAKRLIEENKKFLPIIINNTLDLKQSFLIGINEAISNSKLNDLKINTYYDAVIEIVEMWKNEYPASIKILKKELAKFSMTVDEFIGHMKKYSSDAYEIFKNVYPMICSGMQYNPLVNTDIVKLYEETNNEICTKYGYDGMFVVFDEFSKFIEGSIEKNISNELKLLQDFAEMTSRSKNMQIHLACITHKSINEYISKVPKTRIDAWRAIEGRFKEIYFTTSTKQSYELISNTIIKNKDEVRKIIDENKKISDRYSQEYIFFKDILTIQEFDENIKVGCFPMSGIATYFLPIISEKVAQNERTLFTFLSADDKSTFKKFINDKYIPKLLEIDAIYDYFEVLFKKEMFNKNIQDIWVKVDSSLDRCESHVSKKIIKTLGLIYILNDFDKIAPSVYLFKIALGLNQKKLEDELDLLVSKNIIRVRKNTGFLDFAPMTNYNINEKISGLVNTKFKNTNVAVEFDKFINPDFILPKRYNDTFKMTRYFKTLFMNLNQIQAYYSDEKGLDSIVEDNKCDGVIINLIYEDELDRIEALKIFNLFKNNRVILNVPNKVFSKGNEVRELLAVNTLLTYQELLEEDILIKEQLYLIKEDLEECLKDYYNRTFTIPSIDLDIYYKTKKLNSVKNREFNRELSEIFSKVYQNTVVINNEMINKSNISSQILKVRNNIIDVILKSESIGLYRDTSPEATVYRATIVNKGLNSEEKENDIKYLLEIIEKFILAAEGEKLNIGKLYDAIESLDNGVCIRRGVIPIYLAYEFEKFKDEIIIYLGNKNSKEVELSHEVLNNINENPAEYYLGLEKGSNEKKEYINSLKEIYSIKNDLGNGYKEIFLEMQQWMQGLDKLSRTHLDVSDEIINIESIDKFRNALLKYDVNIREFLFEKLGEIFDVSNYECLISKIRKTKIYLDNYLEEYKKSLIQITKNIFIDNYKGSLAQAILFWFNNLSNEQKVHLFDSGTNEFISYIKNIKNDNDSIVITNLSVILTGLNIGDWNDYTIKEYISRLKEVKNLVESYEIKLEITDTKSSDIKIVINGDEKSFDVEEVSPIGTTVLNNIDEVFEDYGSSISDNEKRNILVRILEKYI